MLKKKRCLAMASAVLGLMLVTSTATIAMDTPVEAQGKVAEKPQMVSLSGSVVDEDGKALEGVSVSPLWQVKEGVATAGRNGMYAAQTDAKGAWSLELPSAAVTRQALPMIAYSADAKKVGYAIVKKGAAGKDLTGMKLTLAKGVEASATLSAGEEKVDETACVLMLKDDNGSHRFGTIFLKGSEVSVYLPKGKFDLTFYNMKNRDLKPIKQSVEVKADSKEVKLGKLTFEVDNGPFKPGGVGKPAPELDVTAVRNTKHKTLAAFKGKWILLDFWGVW